MAVRAYIDGVELEVPTGGSYALTGSITRRLNRPSQATINVPMAFALGWDHDFRRGAAGARLKIEIDDFPFTPAFHGFVMNVETDTGEDTGYTVYNAMDPMELWQWRPVRADDGDFSKPAGDGPINGGPDIIADYVTGPQILQAILLNTQFAGDGPPEDAEGEIFLDLGDFETGGVPLLGAPVDWPMTIAEFVSLLISTGELDVVITPSDPGGGVMGTVDAYNGDYGTDRSGSVIFQYGMGARNVRRVRRNEDMTNMCNKLWYYAGPRIQTAADPAGDQHWCFNVTGDDPGFLDPPFDPLVHFQLLEDRQVSRDVYGVRMQVQIWDAVDEDCVPGVGTPDRMLYRRLWQVESWLRNFPRELIHVTPIRGMGGLIGEFDIGDLVTVQASSEVCGGFLGAQRIYEYTVSWDNDGVLELSELQTSPNMEGGI